MSDCQYWKAFDQIAKGVIIKDLYYNPLEIADLVSNFVPEPAGVILILKCNDGINAKGSVSA